MQKHSSADKKYTVRMQPPVLEEPEAVPRAELPPAPYHPVDPHAQQPPMPRASSLLSSFRGAPDSQVPLPRPALPHILTASYL